MSQYSSKGAAPAALSRRPFDPAMPLHDGCKRPFSPRLLGHGEFKHRDVYRFVSPKENRAVTVCGPFELAVRLRFEFDPMVSAVVERPRKLEVGGKPIELSFWWRERTGREHFALLVPDADTIPGTDGKRRPRQMERLLASADDAGISLRIVTEPEVKDRTACVELCYQLLGFVQSARQLKAGLVLRQEVLATIALYPRVRVEQVAQELGRFPAAHIHIVIAELLYLGAIETDATSRLCHGSLLWRAST